MTEYKQACPNGACYICVNGTLKGNGSAQTNPTATRGAMAYEPISRSWDDVVRASEEVA